MRLRFSPLRWPSLRVVPFLPTRKQTRLTYAAIMLSSLAFGLMLTALWGRHPWQTRAAAGVISGTVFQDYNANGTRDTNASINNSGSGSIGVATDRGIAGVTVTAYNASGAAAGNATTDDQGNYSITATGDAPYRVEFTNLPAGFELGPAGPDSKTTIQFVSFSPASNVSLGLVIPSEYCQDDPVLVTGCYVGGAQNINAPAVVSFPYSAGSTRTAGAAPFNDFDAPGHGIEATTTQVGPTWGIAYARTSKQLFTSAYMKKHSGFGPAGTGAIYKIDRNAANAVSVYADLNVLFGGNTAGVDSHNKADFDRDNDNVTWDAVGKVSLGGMAISADEKKLYVMNLANRSLYELPLDVAPTVANIRVQAVPLNAPGCVSTNDVRPFALNYKNGQLYVGMVCSAESTVSQAIPNGDARQLQAYVYTVNPNTLGFSAAPVFQMALNYPRRCTDSAQLGFGNCFSAAWRAWATEYRNIGDSSNVGVPNVSRGIYPQPMLTDIEFDGGNLVLAFRDRAGDQFGNLTFDNPFDNLRYYGVSAGDVIRACGSPATGWTLENNGRCGGNGSSPQNTGEGPGNGEFYFTDDAQPFADEASFGGALHMPGRPDTAITLFDPIPIYTLETLFDGGVRWLSNTTGGNSKNHRVYDGDLNFNGSVFGKANGLSDLVALCDVAPLEIGNRIWQDNDGDGIQDANEIGIAGLRVLLFKNGVQVGETTTNGRGEFFFNGSNVPGGILTNMAYEIRVAKNQQALANFTLTKNNADGSSAGDSRDSDAVMDGNNAIITLTTGGPGANDHTFDIGFVPPNLVTISCPSNITVTVTGTQPVVVNYPAPTSSTGTTVTCTPPSGSLFPVGTTTVTCTASNVSGTASCSFAVTVSMMKKDVKCDTICFRAPQYYLLNLNRLPGGTVLIAGVNGNQPVGTYNTSAIGQALQGRPGVGALTPLQRLNQEFVAAQLSVNAAGGPGSPVMYNVFWAMLNCYGINFAPVTLSNGVQVAPTMMLGDLFTQTQLAIRENRAQDYAALAAVFDLLNGNDPLGRCGR